MPVEAAVAVWRNVVKPLLGPIFEAKYRNRSTEEASIAVGVKADSREMSPALIVVRTVA